MQLMKMGLLGITKEEKNPDITLEISKMIGMPVGMPAKVPQQVIMIPAHKDTIQTQAGKIHHEENRGAGIQCRTRCDKEKKAGKQKS